MDFAIPLTSQFILNVGKDIIQTQARTITIAMFFNGCPFYLTINFNLPQKASNHFPEPTDQSSFRGVQIHHQN
jgi:hypothetical protein